MISIRVPARICFFGDHQDYLGLPVIAGTINRYLSLEGHPQDLPEFTLDLLDLGKERSLPLEVEAHAVEAGDFLSAALVILCQKGFRFLQGYRVRISSVIPLNAGLSSSSALVVAWIRFLIATQNKRKVSDQEIGQWAYEAEVVFFNSPGGLMDQYTIAQQGLLFINTTTGETKQLTGDLGTLVVAESGLPKETTEVLRNARSFQEEAIAQVKGQHPEFQLLEATALEHARFSLAVEKDLHDHWYAVIHNYQITKDAESRLSSKDTEIKPLGALMNSHQMILENCIKNTPFPMQQMMRAAREAGAHGAKVIGSGGGGCMLAMAEADKAAAVIAAFLNAGAKAAYTVELTRTGE
jgi:galactokinase